MKFAIKTSWMLNRIHTEGYVKVDSDSQMSITQMKKDATRFTSEVLCRGYLVKCNALFPALAFKVVEI